MTQKQRFEYDRVIYELGADSFMTQRGLVIEGNYRIGDKVLLVFDYKSRRYLPAFKREKPPVAEEEERKVQTGRGRGAVLPPRPVLASFYASDMRIYFQVAKKTGETQDKSFYIDLTPVFTLKGHTISKKPYALKLIENHSNLGVLVYFVSPNPSSRPTDIDLGYVIRFELGAKVQPDHTVTKDGKTYIQYGFVYDVDEFSVSESTIGAAMPAIPQCSHGIPNRLLGDADTWYQAGYPGGDWQMHQAIGLETTLGGFTILGPVVSFGQLHWIDNLYADHTSYMGLYVYIGDDEYQEKWIAPIGAYAWLPAGAGHLKDIVWGIHFSCLGKFDYYMREIGETLNEWDFFDSWDRVMYGGTFNVPFMLYQERSVNLAFQDPLGLFSAQWVFDPPCYGPLVDSFAYGDQQIDEGGQHEYPLVHGYPISRAIGSRWPFRYLRTYPIVIAQTLGFYGYLLQLTKTRVEDYWWTPSPKYYEETYLKTPSGTYYISDFLPLYVPLDVPLEVRYGLFPWMTGHENVLYQTPFGYPCRHQGGGTQSRQMLRIAPMSDGDPAYTAEKGKDRSIYIVGGAVYDYNQTPPLLPAEGRASRELFMGVIDSVISSGGAGTLTQKLTGFENLTALDSVFEGYGGGSPVSDGGLIDVIS